MPELVVTAPSESQRLVRRQRWNLFRGIMALLTVLVIGVVGFKVIEGDAWTWLDAAYMAVITMSTVGFAEVKPLSDTGRVFSMVIIVTGVGAFAYTLATFGEQLISGQLVSSFRQRGTEAMMRRLRGHHIVVGYGDTGTIVAAELKSLPGTRVVVIDNDPEAVRNASEDGFMGIQGDGGQDEVLTTAGIERAASLVCTVITRFGGVDDGIECACDGAELADRREGDPARVGAEVAPSGRVGGGIDASHCGTEHC